MKQILYDMSCPPFVRINNYIQEEFLVEIRQGGSIIVEKHVCFIGQGKKLEIWNQETWASQREKWLNESVIDGNLPEKLKTLVL